jgi:DNA-binding CsgD family transcriptional regulator
MDDSTFDTLVAGFYRAATGETSWNVALDGVQAAFGARTALLQSIDMRSGQILSLCDGGPPMPEAMLDYVREYHRIDPRRNHLLARGASGLGEWWHCHEHFDQRFVENDPFYREFLPAYDTRYVSTVMLMPAEHVLTAFAFELPASRGVLSVDERVWARRLGQHMQEALRAYQRVRELAAQALAGHGLLRSFSYPMWLIDAERFIHFANDAAAIETDTETRLVRRGTHLMLARQRADALLTERLHALRTAAHGSTAVVDLRLTASDPPTWLHLSLLIPGAVLGAFGERPLVLATLFDPNHVSTLDPFALSSMLKLTPTQAKVAARLAEGMTPEQIAAAHGTSLATTRSHVREVLARLGARRVADVVRMLRQGEALWASAGRMDAV